jgi:hypothetical protein
VLLTLLQSRGGGPSASARGWDREREILRASLEDIARTMSESERPQARRIARKLVDYTGDLEQIRSLQREIGKLQAAQAERIAQTQAQAQQDSELRAAAAELRSILLDEEDTLQALMALEDMEARHLLGVLGISVH